MSIIQNLSIIISIICGLNSIYGSIIEKKRSIGTRGQFQLPMKEFWHRYYTKLGSGITGPESVTLHIYDNYLKKEKNIDLSTFANRINFHFLQRDFGDEGFTKNSILLFDHNCAFNNIQLYN